MTRSHDTLERGYDLVVDNWSILSSLIAIGWPQRKPSITVPQGECNWGKHTHGYLNHMSFIRGLLDQELQRWVAHEPNANTIDGI